MSAKKLRKEDPEAVTTNTDMVRSLIVYQHMKKVSPKLAEELSAFYILPHVSKYLQKISPEVAGQLQALQKTQKKPDKGKAVNTKTGTIQKRFTRLEDEVLKAAIEEAGEKKVDFGALAKRLNRYKNSITERIETLKRNGGITKKMPFSLVEDTMILETLVIPRVGREKLSEIVLQKHHHADLTKQLGKSSIAVAQRWNFSLQPWLLQHYSGTLNLRLERMLANYISDNYSEFSSIDWPNVAAKTEFAGQTENSLRDMYFKNLSKGTKMKFSLSSEEVTPEHITEYSELVYGLGAIGKAKARLSTKKMNRQKDVIDIFERRVADLKLNNFL